LTSKSINGEREPWVVASRLRDHLLLPRERKDPVLWKKVFPCLDQSIALITSFCFGLVQIHCQCCKQFVSLIFKWSHINIFFYKYILGELKIAFEFSICS
jgi:hypothetical protein